jgi:hypothetical protein
MKPTHISTIPHEVALRAQILRLEEQALRRLEQQGSGAAVWDEQLQRVISALAALEQTARAERDRRQKGRP